MQQVNVLPVVSFKWIDVYLWLHSALFTVVAFNIANWIDKVDGLSIS